MIGDRIQQARKAAGLSLRALADKASVTAMAISKYENNQSTPSSTVLLALAAALGVRTEYFFRSEAPELTDVNHREGHNLPEKEEQKVLADVKEQLERWQALEEIAPAPWSVAFTLPSSLPDQIHEYDEIEDIALAMRQHWDLGLDPIPDLIDTIETKGIKVLITRYDGHKLFNGLSARVKGAPVVVVGQNWPGDRQRFTLAHEIGHLVLAGRVSEALNEELACHRFAGAFLAPKPAVIARLGERCSNLEMQELYLLKQDWGLSMQAWSFRAKELGIISQVTYRTLWRERLAKYKDDSIEPGDQYPKEKTSLFKQLVYRALAENRISESKAAELLGMSTMELYKMRNMEFSLHVADK